MMFRAFALCLIAAAAFAQTKPTLAPADYGKWETLGAGTLSPDGKWLAHEVRRTSGDGELRVAPVAGGKSHVVSFCSGAAFSSDSRWLGCLATVSEADQEKAKKAKKPVQTKLTTLDLTNGTVATVDDIQSFAFAGEGAYLALRKYPPTPATPASAPAAGAKDVEKDPTGAVLLVRNLTSGVDTTFGNITSYSWQDKGVNLAMTIGVDGRTGNALQLFDPRAGSIRVLDNGPSLFTAVTWRKDSSDLAALRSVKDEAYDGESYVALAWRGLADKITTKVDAPQRIVSSRSPQWSEDGATLYLGVAPWLKKVDAKKSDDDPATVEVWHWQDVNVISEQKLNTARDRDRNALAAWHLASNKLVPLTTNVKEDVRLPRSGNRALALDGVPYQDDSMFGRNFADVYKVDLTTGARAEVAKHVIPPVDFSPGGRYAMNFKEGDYWLYDLESGAVRNLTKDAKLALTNKENDYPVSQKPSYGIAGWTKGDRSVIVYDSNDLWEVAPDGASKPKRLTDGAAEDIRYRYVRVGAAARAGDPIELDKPVYLSMDGRWTKKSGYSVLQNGSVDRLVFQDKSVTGLTKAKDADTLLYRAGAWNESPNFFAGVDLKSAHRVSETNPFAADYAWGKSELIEYKNSHGDRLQGALYYPANYEKGKQYPMIVQIYEIESNQLHLWTAPSERATYNPAVWTQHGYFVYRPDIVFKPRDPGMSALDCVTAAVKKALESGMIDAKHVGLTGHSWGGYETTFILTHSDLFAAGAVGGALTNLSSSVGEIYWNSGVPETGHVEVSQERMQVPLYEDPQAYIRNSATFVANKLAAPLLMEVGDHDGASDWHQDIEFYNVARRAGKPVVMLVYEGENHAVAQKANQIDYHRRINAWFDHYLKGASAEDWMTKGVTVLERERELKSTMAPSIANPK